MSKSPGETCGLGLPSPRCYSRSASISLVSTWVEVARHQPLGRRGRLWSSCFGFIIHPSFSSSAPSLPASMPAKEALLSSLRKTPFRSPWSPVLDKECLGPQIWRPSYVLAMRRDPAVEQINDEQAKHLLSSSTA